MDAYNAGQQLGTLLFGGADAQGNDTPSLFDALSGNTTQGATYNKTLLQGASAQNAMQQARVNRAKAMIEEQRAAERAKLPSAVSGAYANPQMAALAEAVLGGNETSDLRDLGSLQNPNALGALGQAATDMQGGDFAGYNQQTDLAAGKPYEPVRVVGNTMLPSGVPLGDAAFTPQATPVGSADITLKNALGDAASALAQQRTTLTPLKADYTRARTDATLHPPVRPKAPSATAADDTAYIQKLQRAFAGGKSYAQIAAAAQQDGKLDLFLKHFGSQDEQGDGN
jgi:hypothetical protein